MAIKFSSNKLLMDEEIKNIKYISDRTNFKLPEIFFTYSNIISMEYFEGKNANEKQFLKIPLK